MKRSDRQRAENGGKDMAIRNIVTHEDEILTKKCRPVEKFDKRLHMLLDDMAETLLSLIHI